MTDLTASIIRGTAQGHMLGTSIANAQNANDWKRAYGLLMKDYNNLVKKFDKLADMYKNIQARRDEYAGMVEERNTDITELNTALLSANADRTRAYDFIIEISNELRKFDPNNVSLSNPNAVLSEVNFYSAQRMRESSKRMDDEITNNTTSQFSKQNNKSQFDIEAEKRTARALKYKEAADNGVTDVDVSVTPRF